MCDSPPADDTPHDGLPVILESVVGDQGRPTEVHSCADGDDSVGFKRRRANKKKPWRALKVSPASGDEATAPRTSRQILAAPVTAAVPVIRDKSCNETKGRPLADKKNKNRGTEKEVRQHCASEGSVALATQPRPTPARCFSKIGAFSAWRAALAHVDAGRRPARKPGFAKWFQAQTGVAGVRLLRAALCDLELRRRDLDGSRTVVRLKSTFRGRPRAILSAESSDDEGAPGGTAGERTAAGAAAEEADYFDGARDPRDDWGGSVRRALLRLAGARSSGGSAPLRGVCAAEASRPLHVAHAARAAIALTRWLAGDPMPLVSAAAAAEASEAAEWVVAVYPLYEAFARACAAPASFRGSAGALPASADPCKGDGDRAVAGALFVRSLELTVITEGPPVTRPPLPKVSHDSGGTTRGGEGVYLLCRIEGFEASLPQRVPDRIADSVSDSAAAANGTPTEQQSLRLGRLVAVVLPSRAAARAPPSLAGARLTIAGESRLLPTEVGRNYGAVLLPPPLTEEECLLEVFPTFASDRGVLRFRPPLADAFPLSRMRDETRAATAAQLARVASSGADVLINGALDAALRARDSSDAVKAPVDGAGGAATSEAEGLGADGTGDASEACPVPATAGNKRSRDENRDVVVVAAGDGARSAQSARHLRESVVRRMADALVSCDGRAVSLLHAALDPPAAAVPGANTAASVAAGTRLLPRFSDAEVAGARVTAQKQLKLFAPAATCAYCLCEHADERAYSVFSARLSMLVMLPPQRISPAPAPASATAPLQLPPASLADAVKAWAAVRQGCDQRSAVLGDYAQGTLECSRHWRLRIRTEGLLRHVCTASVELRYARCRNAAAHAAAALLLDDFGGLASEYYVKGSAEAAAATARAAAVEAAAVVAAADVPSSPVGATASQTTAATSVAEAPGPLHSPVCRAMPDSTANATRAVKPVLAASVARASAVRDFFAHVAARVRHGVVEGGADAAARAAGGAAIPGAAVAPVQPTGYGHGYGGDFGAAVEKRADADAFLGAVAGLLESGLRCIGAADAAMRPFEAVLLAQAVLEGVVAVHAAFYAPISQGDLLAASSAGDQRISAALRTLAARALSRRPQLSKKTGVALAEALAMNTFAERGEGRLRAAGSFSWPYVAAIDDSEEEGAEGEGQDGGSPHAATRWAVLKISLARLGWGYVGHGSYGETGGIAPEDCEGEAGGSGLCDSD